MGYVKAHDPNVGCFASRVGLIHCNRGRRVKARIDVLSHLRHQNRAGIGSHPDVAATMHTVLIGREGSSAVGRRVDHL